MKAYLGDGVYLETYKDGIVLTTENGISVTNRIYLEYDILNEFMKYVTQPKYPVSIKE